MILPLPKPGYTNLSVPQERSNQVRRIYESLNLDESFAQWSMTTLESGVSKIEFMQKTLSHINFAGIGKNGLAMFDSKKDELLRVYIKNGKLTCSVHKDKPCDHKIFAAMHPKFVC